METELTLRYKVIRELAWDPSLDASQIEVATSNTVITLTGQVRSYAHKLAAERAARRISEVQVLANDLQVRQPFPSQRNDTEIVRAIAAGGLDLAH